jgi:Protein of unknown function (DUF3592)
MRHFPPLFLIVFALVMGGILITIVRQLRQRINISKHGVRVPGQIVAFENQGTDIMHCYPIVRFTTPDGRRLTLTSQTRVSVAELQKGQSIEISYPATAPEQFIIVGGFEHLVESFRS